MAAKIAAFEDCFGLKSIAFPYGLMRIGEHAFEGCRSLDKISLPKNLARIGKAAFEGCISLKTITLPHKIDVIEQDTFAKCVNLKCVSFSGKPSMIGKNAFYRCRSLDKPDIPDIIRVEDGAFARCQKMREYTENSLIGLIFANGTEDSFVVDTIKNLTRYPHHWIRAVLHNYGVSGILDFSMIFLPSSSGSLLVNTGNSESKIVDNLIGVLEEY